MPGREMLARTAAHGEYAIPFIVVVDAFQSETVNFADLVLPDTTYLERYDAISLLDRPISEPDAAGDSIRHPILKPDRPPREETRHAFVIALDAAPDVMMGGRAGR